MCSICGSNEPTRNIDLYVFGSEGIDLCHTCEMKMVEMARQMRSEYLQQKKRDVIQNRNLNP